MGITPAQHDVRCFPISDEHPAVGSHLGLTCEECHRSAESFTDNMCVDCHAALPYGLSPYERHRLIGGFEVSTPLCKACHAENQLDRVFAHEPFLIAPNSPHYRESCFDCHTEWREDKPWAVDFERQDCRGCHGVLEMAGVHETRVPDYVSYELPSCVSCHEDGLVEGRPWVPDGGTLDGGSGLDAGGASDGGQ